MDAIDKLITSSMYQDALREITEKAPAKFSIYDCMDVVCKDIIIYKIILKQ